MQRVVYRNWRGVVALRTVRPLALKFGITDYHLVPQFLLHAEDAELQDTRDFALMDMKPVNVEPGELVTVGVFRSPEEARLMALFERDPEQLVGLLHDKDPDRLKQIFLNYQKQCLL